MIVSVLDEVQMLFANVSCAGTATYTLIYLQVAADVYIVQAVKWHLLRWVHGLTVQCSPSNNNKYYVVLSIDSLFILLYRKILMVLLKTCEVIKAVFLK